MKKVTKALKIVNSLSEEERQEFAEYFKPEDEVKDPVKEEKVEVKEEQKKEEVKKEKEEPQKEDKFEQLLEAMKLMGEKIETIEQKQPKLKTFGAKPKQGEGKESQDFNTIFQNLTKGQS